MSAFENVLTMGIMLVVILVGSCIVYGFMMPDPRQGGSDD